MVASTPSSWLPPPGFTPKHSLGLRRGETRFDQTSWRWKGGRLTHFNRRKTVICKGLPKNWPGNSGHLKETTQLNTLVPVSSLRLKSRTVGVQMTGCVVWTLAHQEAEGIRMIKQKGHLPSAPFVPGPASMRTADQLIQSGRQGKWRITSCSPFPQCGNWAQRGPITNHP